MLQKELWALLNTLSILQSPLPLEITRMPKVVVISRLIIVNCTLVSFWQRETYASNWIHGILRNMFCEAYHMIPVTWHPVIERISEVNDTMTYRFTSKYSKFIWKTRSYFYLWWCCARECLCPVASDAGVGVGGRNLGIG